MILVSKDDFIEYLRKEQYKEYSETGNYSTIPHYVYWIERVMKNENMDTWSELTDHIQRLIKEYGEFGKKKNFGEQGHATVINALKRFSDYLLNERNYMPKTGVWYF